MKPRARLDHVADDQPDEEREGRNDFEVQQRLAADAPDLLHVLHAGDAGNHGAEDDQGDDHRDQADEGVAKRLHGDGVLRAEVAERDSEQHRNDDLNPKGRVPGLFAGGDGDGFRDAVGSHRTQFLKRCGE